MVGPAGNRSSENRYRIVLGGLRLEDGVNDPFRQRRLLLIWQCRGNQREEAMRYSVVVLPEQKFHSKVVVLGDGAANYV